MDQIFAFIVGILIEAHSPVKCDPVIINYTNYEYTYEVPEGITVVQDGWERRRSNLGIADDFGNSFDIYKGPKPLWEDRIAYEREWWGDDLLEEERISDDIVKFYVYNEGPADAFDSIYLVNKDKFLVRVNGYFQGDPSTHGVFEEKALQFVRSIAQGGLKYVPEPSNCANPSLWTWDLGW